MVNINTKTNNHTCVIVRHVVYELRQIPPSSSSSSNEVSPRQNGRQRSVPAMKRQVTKCTCNKMAGDKLAGDEVYPRRNGGDETSCSAHSRLFSGLIVAGTVNICCTKQSNPYQCCCGHRPQLHCRLSFQSPSMQ